MKRILILLIGVFAFIPFSVRAEESLIPNATSGILIEASTGKIIFEKEKDKEVPIASMTKMMAQILILEKIEDGSIKWEDEIVVSRNAADMGGSQIYLSEGEKITIEDLMKGISVASANDATVAMAEVIAGTEEKFVRLMNKKAKKLGLKHTTFKNCTGLDEEGHYSSAYDMALIAQHLLNNHPKILDFSSLYEDYLREDTENKFWLVNTNKLIRFYEGADGLKTGHTDAAKYCLAATAKRGELRLIAIVLGEDNSKVRNQETMSLLDYGFSTVKVNVIKEKNTVVKKIRIDKATKEIVQISLKNNLSVYDDSSALKKKYTYDIKVERFDLPIKRGQKVGTIDAYYKGKKVASSDLTVMEDVNKLGFITLIKNSLIDIFSGVY